VAFGAIALNAAGRAGQPSAAVALQRLVYCQGEIVVVGCRDRSRLVADHGAMITAFVPRLGGYPQGFLLLTTFWDDSGGDTTEESRALRLPRQG